MAGDSLECVWTAPSVVSLNRPLLAVWRPLEAYCTAARVLSVKLLLKMYLQTCKQKCTLSKGYFLDDREKGHLFHSSQWLLLGGWVQQHRRHFSHCCWVTGLKSQSPETQHHCNRRHDMPPTSFDWLMSPAHDFAPSQSHCVISSDREF